MLKLFQSIFGGGEQRGRYPESLIEAAIERTVDGTDPRLRALFGYKKHLRPSVIHAIDHVVALVNSIPAPLDATLFTLAQAAVPLCLVLIGLSMAHYGVAGVVKPAVVQSVLKLLVHPLLVAVAAFWLMPLERTTAAVTVLCAALPIGANPLLFAQRYHVAERETTAAIVISTVAYGGTVIGLLAVLTR